MNSFFITSCPKSGTHLLATIVEKITGSYPISVKKECLRHDKYLESFFNDKVNLVGHFRVSNIASNRLLSELFSSRKVLILIRDPRDVCNSMLHYLESHKNPKHRSCLYALEGLDYNSKLIRISKGIASKEFNFNVPNIRTMMHGFFEVRDLYPSSSFVLKYEELLLGLKSKQISDFFDVPESVFEEARFDSIGKKTKTFRSGKLSVWKGFDKEVIDFFNDEFGDVINTFGYETE